LRDIPADTEKVLVSEAATQVREARLNEVEAVLPCYEWLFAPPAERPELWDEQGARMALTATIEDEDSILLVADHDGELVGFCTAYLDLQSVRFGRRCWVEDLAVHPDRRSEGIGKALLNAAKAWAAEHGSTHLELDTAETRADARRFYEREDPSWRTVSYSWRL
jgi:GNAT superfamily N-acetyltransferase